jgi:hypothetical protein
MPKAATIVLSSLQLAAAVVSIISQVRRAYFDWTKIFTMELLVQSQFTYMLT